VSGAAGNRVVVIDAGGANLGSVCYALERLGAQPQVVRDAAGLEGADRVILPGVGAAPEAMRRLREQGLVEPLRELQVPLLGICLGMQLLYERSEEGEVECLGLLQGVVHHLPAAPGIRVPHMGWNGLRTMRASPLLDGVADGASAYFVHSYAVQDAAPRCLLASTAVEHVAFASLVGDGRVAGAQFHPERSAATGARILRNFIEMDF
jgi:glutamine amidotransferase